jgi:hypothetical protein
MVGPTSLWVEETSVHAGLAKTSSVILAKAGIHSELDRADAVWIPAFAGMTEG